MIASLVEAARAYNENAEVAIVPSAEQHVVIVRVGGIRLVETEPGTLDEVMTAAIHKLRTISTKILAVKVQRAVDEEES